MKIIIIGAGIAGLSTYLFFYKHLARDHPDQYTLQIYEAYDIRRLKYDAPRGEEPALKDSDEEPLFTPKVIGNAIGIGKNGLAVLRRINDDGSLVKKLQDRGSSVAKWRMGTARGWRIVDASVRSKNSEEAQIAETIMISRQAAWEVLRDEVISINEHAVLRKKVSAVEDTPDGKAQLRFTDGSEETADLLIGADGLRSIVRQTMFRDHNDYPSQTWTNMLLRQSSKKKDYITPHYEGLTGLGGFVPSSVLRDTGYEQGAMSITFGPNGFFGHGYIGPVDQYAGQNHDDPIPLAAWWSTFSSDTPRPYQKEAVDGSDATGIKTTFDKDRALSDLLARHRSWKDPTIQAILSYLKKQNEIEHVYPTYTTPELSTWYSKQANMVLVGDAAHALQPSSGQGACQALEDAEALALFLKHYLHHTTLLAQSSPITTALPQALKKYESLRKPRVSKIYIQSQKMSSRKMDMGVVAEYMMYFFIWVATRMQLFKKFNDELFEYDLPREVERALEIE